VTATVTLPSFPGHRRPAPRQRRLHHRPIPELLGPTGDGTCLGEGSAAAGVVRPGAPESSGGIRGLAASMQSGYPAGAIVLRSASPDSSGLERSPAEFAISPPSDPAESKTRANQPNLALLAEGEGFEPSSDLNGPKRFSRACQLDLELA
jgi:hypothetical protein